MPKAQTTRQRIAALLGTALLGTTLVACGSTEEAASTPSDSSSEATTITVETASGPVEVPVLPRRVAALDNTSVQTLKEFGIEPVAVAKPLIRNIAEVQDWYDNEEILDVGSHREPQLEAVSEAEPDLIIGGYRFADYTDELSKIATTIDIAPDEEAEGGYVESLKAQTLTLGKIFKQEDKAAELIDKLEESTKRAASATQGETVFLGAAGGGKIDNGAGRLGRIIVPLNLTDVFAEDDEDLDSGSHHNDSGLSPETIAQANPDWIIVFDFDAATNAEGASPARQVIDSQEAWKDTTFITEDHVVVLPTSFYLTEGIIAYTEVFDQIAEAFETA